MAKKDAGSIASYQVQYLGGLLEHPKSKAGFIELLLQDDCFQAEPDPREHQVVGTSVTIPYSDVNSVSIVARTVGTAEGLLGGLNSRQLKTRTTICTSTIRVPQASGPILRVEMLSGVTVMGQAKKAKEFEDRLRANGILAKFRAAAAAPGMQAVDIPGQLARLGEMHSSAGIRTDEEFAAKKTELLARL